MPLPSPFIGSPQTVEDLWIDYNGHFNMAYYNVIFDRCGDEAFALMGLGPDYVKTANCSFDHGQFCAVQVCRTWVVLRKILGHPYYFPEAVSSTLRIRTVPSPAKSRLATLVCGYCGL